MGGLLKPSLSATLTPRAAGAPRTEIFSGFRRHKLLRGWETCRKSTTRGATPREAGRLPGGFCNGHGPTVQGQEQHRQGLPRAAGGYDGDGPALPATRIPWLPRQATPRKLRQPVSPHGSMAGSTDAAPVTLSAPDAQWGPAGIC